MKPKKQEQQERKEEVAAEIKNLHKLHALRIYLWENFDPKDPLYAGLYFATEQLIADKQDDIAILRGCDLIKNNKRKKYVFEVGRERIGAADVYLNGELIYSFFDENVKLTDHDKAVTDIVRGFASRIPDALYVKAALYAPAGGVSAFSDKIKSIFDRDIPEEILEEQRRNVEQFKKQTDGKEDAAEDAAGAQNHSAGSRR